MSRAAIALGRVSFRFGFFFLVFALIQYPALHSGTFGGTPIIPTAFLVCVNLIATLVCLAVTVAATMASLKPFFFSWRALGGWVFTLGAAWIGFGTCIAVLTAS